ncbi:MAG: hypothetical protein JSS07_12490 [Proteobacteria bacterium]|nr:hypothetical protein [Pseudomonadota bacterium]
MLNLHQDFLQPIFKYLSQEDAFALRTTCKAFNVAATSNKVVMRFLNRLKAIDRKVSVLSSEDASDTWCYTRFIVEFNRIANIQAQEIRNFITNIENLPKDDDIQKNVNLLRSLNEDHRIDLDILEKRHNVLEHLNATLIKKHIEVNVPYLDCSSSYITRFPESLFTDKELENFWKEIETMDCSKNQIRTLPNALGKCEALKRLYCNDNLLQSLPDSLCECQKLQGLFCSNNKLQALPKALGNCQDLTKIECSDNQLETLPESLNQCKELKLNCGKNRLKTLPESLCKRGALRELSCDRNELTTLPESLGESQELRVLNCYSNKLLSLPESLGKCLALTLLDCANNNLENLPKSLGNCQSIVTLRCYGNKLQTLPDSLGKCQNLKNVYCYNNNLLFLPQSISNCLALEELYCNHNQLKALPESIGNCARLRELECSYNQLQILPESLDNCTRLKLLNCNNNFLTVISPKIKDRFLLPFWYTKMLASQNTPPITVSLNMPNSSITITATNITKDDSKPQKDISNAEIKSQVKKPAPSEKTWLIKLATALVSTILFSFMIAASGGLPLMMALLLNAGITLSTTKATLMIVSLISGFAMAATLFALYHSGLALKTAILRCQQTPDQRFDSDCNAYDKQLTKLAENFSVNTTRTFIKPLRDIEPYISRTQLIQYKQFEISAFKEVLALNGEARNKAKIANIIAARKKVSCFRVSD